MELQELYLAAQFWLLAVEVSAVTLHSSLLFNTKWTKQSKEKTNLKQNLVGSSKKVWSRVILEENRKFIREKKLCKVVRKNRLVCIKNL